MEGMIVGWAMGYRNLKDFCIMMINTYSLNADNQSLLEACFSNGKFPEPILLWLLSRLLVLLLSSASTVKIFFA